MIGLLDPALFLPRDEREVVRDFDLVLRACRQHQIKLTSSDEYWSVLWRGLGRELERDMSREGKSTLREVRELGEKRRVLTNRLSEVDSKAWRQGFDIVFGPAWLDEKWIDVMAMAVIRAVRAATIDERVVVLCRRLVGRNVAVHRAKDSALEEVTRWMLHVRLGDLGHRQVLCIHHPRNISETWTCRFDWRLPSVSDGARYPFCVPNHWWNGKTKAVGVVRSMYCWIDALGDGWARPSIRNGTGQHWDVFMQEGERQRAIGVHEINVVEFGANVPGKNPGDLHHVPRKKQSVVKDVGWTCGALQTTTR